MAFEKLVQLDTKLWKAICYNRPYHGIRRHFDE